MIGFVSMLFQLLIYYGMYVLLISKFCTFLPLFLRQWQFYKKIKKGSKSPFLIQRCLCAPPIVRILTRKYVEKKLLGMAPISKYVRFILSTCLTLLSIPYTVCGNSSLSFKNARIAQKGPKMYICVQPNRSEFLRHFDTVWYIDERLNVFWTNMTEKCLGRADRSLFNNLFWKSYSWKQFAILNISREKVLLWRMKRAQKIWRNEPIRTPCHVKVTIQSQIIQVYFSELIPFHKKYVTIISIFGIDRKWRILEE